MRHAAGALLAVLAAACAAPQARADACESQIPQSLARALSRAFPGYRVPLEYDNAPEDINENRSHGGTGCLGVGTADFTGDLKKDYVVGLTSVKGNGGLAVIALPQPGGWRFVQLQRWAEHTRASRTVSAVAPGRYGAIDCPYAGARIGTVEAGATVWCYLKGKWLHGAAAD